jgi:hypothetical protein
VNFFLLNPFFSSRVFALAFLIFFVENGQFFFEEVEEMKAFFLLCFFAFRIDFLAAKFILVI